METQREKEAISPAEPWKSGVPVQMAAEGDRGNGKAGREGRKSRQDPTDAADRRGLLSGRTGGGRRGIPAGKGERERGTRGFLGQVSAGLHVSDQKSSLNRKTALNKILDHSKVQSAPGASA